MPDATTKRKPAKTPRTKHRLVRIPEVLAVRVAKIAKINGRTFVEQIREAVRNNLALNERHA